MAASRPGEGSAKAPGQTESEKLLARLGRVAFLSPWAYPSPFRNQGNGRGGDGKELCDLLVIFDEDVVIFSDKTCKTTAHNDPNVVWSRWYRDAIDDSIKQVLGAERWLRESPDRVFVDRRCTVKLPVTIPTEPRRTHRVVLARGSVAAATAELGYPTGFGFSSDASPPVMTGKQLRAETNAQPFVVGAWHRDAAFVHVFDDLGINEILRHLDTAPDFIRYLRQREALMSSGRRYYFLREVDFLAMYLKHKWDDPDGYVDADASLPAVAIEADSWERFLALPQYKSRTARVAISYRTWDHIIETFAHYGRNGELHTLTGPGGSLDDDVLRPLRILAKESRFSRTVLSRHLRDVLDSATASAGPFTRTCLMEQSADVVYVLSGVSPEHCYAKSEAQYRERRRAYLEMYSRIVANRHRGSRWIVGIASEPANEVSRTFDMVLLDNSTMSNEAREEAEQDSKVTGFYTKERIRDIGVSSSTEYPPLERAVRRIVLSGKSGRNAPCPCGSGQKYKKCCGSRGTTQV